MDYPFYPDIRISQQPAIIHLSKVTFPLETDIGTDYLLILYLSPHPCYASCCVLDWSIGSPQFRMGQVRPLSHPNPPLHDRTLLLSETTPQLFRTYYFNLCLRNGFILNAHLLCAFSLGPLGVELLAFLVRQPSQTFPEPCPASLLLVVRQLPVLGPFRSCHVVRFRRKGFRYRSRRGCCGRRRCRGS